MPVTGVAIDVLNAEEAAAGLRSAMTAREAHKGSVAAVADKQAELEVEKVEHCFARKFEVESGEVEHCSARTAVMLQYFPAEAGIEAGYCRRRNWVAR